eukprot:COSAG06_NODE_769_length_12440_cov_7.241796_10_plen_106_part_00
MNDTEVAAELALPCWRTNLLFDYEAFQVRKRYLFAPFYSTNDQFCQDRLGTNTGKAHKQEWRFLAAWCDEELWLRLCIAQVRKRRFFAPFYSKNDHFTKTRSGQT